MIVYRARIKHPGKGTVCLWARSGGAARDEASHYIWQHSESVTDSDRPTLIEITPEVIPTKDKERLVGWLNTFVRMELP